MAESPIEIVGPDARFPAGVRPLPACCIDFDPVGYVGQGCARCRRWSVEVVHTAVDGWVIREWHDPQCPELTEWQ